MKKLAISFLIPAVLAIFIMQEAHSQARYSFDYNAESVTQSNIRSHRDIKLVKTRLQNSNLFIEIEFNQQVAFFNEFISHRDLAQKTTIRGIRYVGTLSADNYKRFIEKLPEHVIDYSEFSTTVATSHLFVFRLASFSNFEFTFHYYPMEARGGFNEFGGRVGTITMSFNHKPAEIAIVSEKTSEPEAPVNAIPDPVVEQPSVPPPPRAETPAAAPRQATTQPAPPDPCIQINADIDLFHRSYRPVVQDTHNELLSLQDKLRKREIDGLMAEKRTEDAEAIINEIESKLQELKLTAERQRCAANANIADFEKIIRDIRQTVYAVKRLAAPDFIEFCLGLEREFSSELNAFKERQLWYLSEIEMIKDESINRMNEYAFYNRHKNQLLQRLDELLIQYRSDSLSFIGLMDSFNNKIRQARQYGNRTMIFSSNYDGLERNFASLSGRLYNHREDIRKIPPDSPPYALYSIIGIIALFVFIGVIFYIKSIVRKKKEQKIARKKDTQISIVSVEPKTIAPEPAEQIDTPQIKPSPSEVTSEMIQVVQKKTANEAGKGLKHVNGDQSSAYFPINLYETWEDSSVKMVYIKNTFIIKIYEFFSRSLSSEGAVTETGGYIIGNWDYNPREPQKYDLSFEDFIEPGDDAVYGEYELNFGAKIGIKLEHTISNYKEKSGKSFVLVAWIHSHPGLQIFLSTQDLRVHGMLSDNTHKNRLIALVLDTKTDDLLFGFFSYKSDHTLNNTNGEMKYHSLEEMRDWAISSGKPAGNTPFSALLKEVLPTSKLSGLYFKNSAIIEIDLFVSGKLSDNNPAIGLCKGTVNNPDIPGNKTFTIEGIIENLEELTNNSFGGLVCVNTTIQELKTSYQAVISNKSISFIIIYDHSEKEILVYPADQQQNFHENQPLRIQFMEMKKWTRRK